MLEMLSALFEQNVASNLKVSSRFFCGLHEVMSDCLVIKKELKLICLIWLLFLQSGSDDGYYNCEDIPFFEIGNVYYEEYLVNVRLPSLVKNNQIGKITDINFVVS